MSQYQEPRRDYFKCKVCGWIFQFGTITNFVMCPACVIPGTVILGDNKPIENYTDNNHCIGSSSLTTVNHVLERHYCGNMIKVKGLGMLPFIVTSDHPIRVVQGHGNRISFNSPSWKDAQSLKPKHSCKDGDYLLIPRLEGNTLISSIDLSPFTSSHGLFVTRAKHYPTSLFLNNQVAWLMGLYVAEGYAHKEEELHFCLNFNEIDLQSRLLQISQEMGYKARIQKCSTSAVVCIPSRLLSRAFRMWFGKGATNKQIPDFILFHKDIEILKSFLDGYVAGDGFIDHDHDNRGLKHYRIRCTTASLVLAQQLQLAYARLGLFASIKSSMRTSGVVLGRQVINRMRYDVNVVCNPAQTKRTVKIFDKYLFVPLAKVEKIPYNGLVYNLQTIDNTFLISNAITHNCGARDLRPKKADKMDWIDWQRKMKRISTWQHRYWNPHTTDL